MRKIDQLFFRITGAGISLWLTLCTCSVSQLLIRKWKL